MEQLKHQDEEPNDFILNVAQMLAIEFEDLHRTDLNDKLDALFGELPPKAFEISSFVPSLPGHFMMRAIPNSNRVTEDEIRICFCDFDNRNVLCYTSDRTTVELIPIDSASSLGKISAQATERR